jgi:hypothetical protein
MGVEQWAHCIRITPGHSMASMTAWVWYDLSGA